MNPVTWACGAPHHPPRQTRQRRVREYPPFLQAACRPIKSLTVADFSTLPKTMPRSPSPPPNTHPRRDRGRRSSGRVPRVQPALSCRCPSRSKRPRRVGGHKRPPTSGLPRRPLLPGGAVGPQEARKGYFCGWGSRSARGWRGDPLLCVRGGGAAGTRAARREAAPSDRSCRGHPRTRQSRRPRRSLPKPSPTPVHSPTLPALQTNATPGTTSRPGPPHRAPRSPPLPSTGQKVPLNAPGGGSPFPLPAPGEAALGRRTSPRAPRAAPDPGETEQRNKSKLTDLSRRRRRQHCRGGPGAPATRSARRAAREPGERRERGAGVCSPSSGPARGEAPHLPRRPPRSRPDSAAWRWAVSGSLGVTAQQTHRAGGGGRPSSAPRGPALPSGSTSSSPSPLLVRDVRLSVCLSGVANHFPSSCLLSLVPAFGLVPMGPASAGTSTSSFPRVNVGPKLEAGVKGGRAQPTEGRGGREAVCSSGPWGPSEEGVEILTLTETAWFPVAWLTLKVHIV